MLSPRRNRMGNRLREPFGKAGLTVAILALVFAMVGGAWAAAGLNSKQKKEVKAIAKSFQGAGPAGAVGPAGAKGDNGSNGSNGAKGDKGDAGGNGASVTAVAATAAECNGVAGGVKYTLNAVETKICNGKNGTTGFTETLPSGKTETGVWSAEQVAEETFTHVPFSYGIPLENKIEAANVKVIQKEATSTECPGAEPTPEAEPGFLCIYVTETNLASVFGGLSTTTASGAVLSFALFGVTEPFMYGVWAVTAE